MEVFVISAASSERINKSFGTAGHVTHVKIAFRNLGENAM